MTEPLDPTQQAIIDVLQHRAKHGGAHPHHRDCIHNLPPEQQITARGKTVEWWMKVVGSMPTQITPADWECDPPAGSSGNPWKGEPK